MGALNNAGLSEAFRARFSQARELHIEDDVFDINDAFTLVNA